MKKVFTLLIGLVIASTGLSQYFIPVDEGSQVSFKIKNFGVNVGGTFTGLKGMIIFDTDSLNASSFDVTVDAATVNTGIDQRDNHLKKEEYFDIAKYPTIHFISTKVTTSTDKAYLFLFGKLTIKDITKEISFPFKATKKDDHMVFEGEFSINRRDYTVGGGSITMSDDLTVRLSVLAKKE